MQCVIFNLVAICMLVNLHTLNTSPLLHRVPLPSCITSHYSAAGSEEPVALEGILICPTHAVEVFITCRTLDLVSLKSLVPRRAFCLRWLAWKRRKGGEDAWSRGVQGKKGNCLACVNSRRKETSSAETLPSAREAGHFG